MRIRPRSYKSLLFVKLPEHEIVSQWLQGLPNPTQGMRLCCVGSRPAAPSPARPGSATPPSGQDGHRRYGASPAHGDRSSATSYAELARGLTEQSSQMLCSDPVPTPNGRNKIIPPEIIWSGWPETLNSSFPFPYLEEQLTSNLKGKANAQGSVSPRQRKTLAWRSAKGKRSVSDSSAALTCEGRDGNAGRSGAES